VTVLQEQPSRVSWRQQLVVYPLLFAAWPVLFLYARNVGETPIEEAVRLLTYNVAIGAAVFGVLAVVLRDARRAGMASSALILGLLLWGHVRNLAGDPTWLLPLWLLVVVLCVAGAVRLRSGLGEATTILTGVSVVLVALSLLTIWQAKAPAFASAPASIPTPTDLEPRVGPWSEVGDPRDIYYLIFDRYPSEKNMRAHLGYDNHAFTANLQRRGFYVAPDSTANYLKTAASLSSSLNLRYLDDMPQRYGPDTGNLLPMYELLRNHQLGNILKRRGYEYVHIGAWWDGTQHSPQADANLGYDQTSDFEIAWWETTLLSEVGQRPSQMSGDEQRRVHYDGALRQFKALRTAMAKPGPTFTFAHILLPHEPFVFDRRGRYVSLLDDARRGRTLGYIEQTQYTNGLISAFLDDLLDVPEADRPIVVIQADEGPHPVRYKLDETGFDWEQATDEELREKFQILNAYLLPGLDDPGLYASITPVNTWRLILNRYFGAELPLLDDRSYIFRSDAHVYDYSEVSDRVQCSGPCPDDG
jgi:hypothetical protein